MKETGAIPSRSHSKREVWHPQLLLVLLLKHCREHAGPDAHTHLPAAALLPAAAAAAVAFSTATDRSSTSWFCLASAQPAARQKHVHVHLVLKI